MSISVHGLIKDAGGATRVTKLRRESYANASPLPDPKDHIRELADALHPAEMKFRCISVKDASPTSKTFRFESLDGHIPVFQCGQYVNFRFKIGESTLSRPYSISSAPYEARYEKPFFEVTIRRNVPYLVPDYMFENVHEGDVLDGTLPFGTFYWEPVLYGSVKSDDIVLKDELAAVEKACSDVKIVHVLSDDPDWEGEKGFISKEIIEKYSTPDCTYMFCGPRAMYLFVDKALKELGVEQRRFRHDVVNNPADITKVPGYPEEAIGKTFNITVVRGIQEDIIPAKAEESIAIAIERAGILLNTHCRNGECGLCRAHVLSGAVYTLPDEENRRRMDREMGWYHLCSAWPLSDVKVKIPIM